MGRRTVIGDYRSVLNWEELGSDVSTQEFFTPPVFDVLWDSMRLGDMPYPLAVASHGATENERVRLRNRVLSELAARELCDANGRFAPHIESWLGLLSRPARSVDALHIPAYEADPVAVVAAADEHNAVVATQDSEGIRIRPTHPDGLVSTVVEQLPPGRRGTESSISLPLNEALHIRPDRMPTTRGGSGNGTGDEDDEQAPGRRGKRRQQRSLAERERDPRQAYARLAGQPRLCGGQLAANSRSFVGHKQRSPALAWFDTATGRYMSLSGLGSDGREWVTVSPADAKTLRSRLDELIASLTR